MNQQKTKNNAFETKLPTGEKKKSKLYRIGFARPWSLREILTAGSLSTSLRILICTLSFTALELVFVRHTMAVLNFLTGKDWPLILIGLAFVILSILLGKKFGRSFGLACKWIGLPLVFTGFLILSFVRLGLGAYWAVPYDLITGETLNTLLTETAGFSGFSGTLGRCLEMKAFFIKDSADTSIFLSLMRYYRTLGASMDFFFVIPVLIIISLGVFLGMICLICLCGIIPLLLPSVVCFILTRLMCLADKLL